MTTRTLYILLCLASVGAVYEWWPILRHPAHPTSEVRETWVRPPLHAPGEEYHRYRIELKGGRIVHAEGTHYVLERGGMGLMVKDAGHGDLVFVAKDEDVVSIGREE